MICARMCGTCLTVKSEADFSPTQGRCIECKRAIDAGRERNGKSPIRKQRRAAAPRLTAGELTAEFVRSILDYDPETGAFRWRTRRGTVAAGSVAGRFDRDGYREISINRRTYRAHRLAWLMTYGAWPSKDIDHINGLPYDNRISNLRDVTPSKNMQNLRRGHRDSKSGLLGAHWRAASNTWHSTIKLRGAEHYLGKFDTEIEAHRAYVDAKRKLHEGNTL